MSIRFNREFLQDLRKLSGNAVKLYVWLALSAHRSGPKRGCVAVNVEDIMHGLGWSRSMAKRSLEELASGDYISFRGAANQHALGLIRICKFDAKEGSFGQLTSEPSKHGVAQSTGEPSTDSDNSADEPAAQLITEPSTELTTEPSSEPSNSSSSQGQQDLQALGIASLPARNADFAHLAEVNPRVDTEDLRGWAERLLSLSNERNIFFPRQVFARARDAAA